jgi:hypothetical protein
MTRRLLTFLLLLPFLATAAAAQQAPAPAAPPAVKSEGIRPWVVIGGGYTSVLGDCPDCTAEPNYRSAGSFLANIGVSLNSRADIGAELMWVPSTTVSGETLRTTFVMAVGQFRFWKNRGFFVKGGGGMAFVRNWVVDLSGGANTAPPFTSKALSVGIGAGWEWRLRPRFGVQVFGSQHVAALGDLQANQTVIENVVGNFWTVGGAIVFR